MTENFPTVIFNATYRKMYTIPKLWAAIPYTFFQLVALSTNLYIVPQLVVSKVCLTTYNQSVCKQLGKPKFKPQENDVYEKAAGWNGLIFFVGFFPALIVTLPLGAMADFVSKKKMLLLPAIATLVSSLINLWSALDVALHIGVLAIGSFASCIYGEIPGCITMACTYTASASSADDVSVAMAMNIAAVELGLAIGGLVTNYLQESFGFPSVFIFTSVLLTVNLFYTIVLIPSTDDDGGGVKRSDLEQYCLCSEIMQRTKDTWNHMISFIIQLFKSEDKTILFLLVAAFLNLASYGGERALIALFLKHSPLSLSPNQIGIYIAIFQCSRGIGLLILSCIAKKCLSYSNSFFMFFGTIFMIIHYTFTGLSTTITMVFCSTIFAIPGSFMATTARSELAKLVPPESHGISLSLIGVMDVLGEVIMAVSASGLFVATSKIYSGLSIMLMSCTNLVALLILSYVFCCKKERGPSDGEYTKI